jgi:hypothetical protein
MYFQFVSSPHLVSESLHLRYFIYSPTRHANKVVVMFDGGFTLATLSRQHGKGHPLPFGVGRIGGGPYRVGKSIPMPLCLFITNIVATGYIGVAFR